MLLGKRPRPPMKRTTSMTKIILGPASNGGEGAPPPSDPQNLVYYHGGAQKQSLDGSNQPLLLSTVSPRNQRRHSSDFQFKTAQFLKACSLCQRNLVCGRDIYMYRGDRAFCSLECRQHQMNQDDRKEKCSSASKKEAASSSSSIPVAAQVSSNGETVAAL